MAISQSDVGKGEEAVHLKGAASLSLPDIEAQFDRDIHVIRTEDDLARLKAAYLGKGGRVTECMRGLGQLPPDQRPAFGSQVNQLKQKIEASFRDVQEKIARDKREEKLRAESVDVTLPGRAVEAGGLHPITLVMEEVENIFREIGFSIHEGPEIETDFFNFEALNIPKNHPARDMQDTFYLEGAAAPLQTTRRDASRTGRAGSSPLLLRTHTSPVQIHVMKKMKPPIRMIAPGAVYRRDSDISHTPMFHQVEGLVVAEGVQFAHLKGVVSYVLQRLFGDELHVRFRPSYFPFTEPSAEVDIQCVICRGKKTLADGNPCRLCKSSGWLEVMGCGMVHPAVFEKVGYDAKKYSGFAFGMGIERLSMLKFGIPDIRLFFENDLRFLRQF